MTDSLFEHLSSLGEPQFDDRPWYNSEGDCLEVCFTRAEYHSRRLDSFLTVYLDDAREIVGFQIKGLTALVSRFKEIGYTVASSRVSISILLLLSHFEAERKRDVPESDRRDVYDDLMSKVGKVEVESLEVCS